MKVIVDTCIWSLALRRNGNKSDPAVISLTELINDSRVQMIGPIRQEILSGIKSETKFKTISKIVRAFPDISLEIDDYELAARFYNLCRGKGVQGSNTDFLICAVSFRHKMPIFSNDKDFLHYKKHLKIELFQI